MKIIITMAGLGNRFKLIGIDKPKYQLVANGKTLFEWSMLSLKDFFNEEFIFIIRKEIYDELFLENSINKLGLINFRIVLLDVITDGQASTAFAANNFIESDESIVIYNIDTYVNPDCIKKSDILDIYYGFIPVVEESGNKWSYVKIDSQNQVIEIAEKKQISNLATIGFYYFKYWKDFRQVYLEYKDEIKRTYKEVYIAPMYEYLIKEKKNIGTKILNRDTVIILGTPEEVTAFDKDYLNRNL